MKRKSWLCLLLCAIFVLQLSACSSTSLQEKKQIAVIVKSENSEFWQTVKKGVDAAATEYNVSVTFEGPQNEEDYQAQNEMIEHAVERGVDAIVISAIDYNRCADAVTLAAQKGIKIVAIDSTVHASVVNMFVGTDNLAAGEMAATAAIQGFSPQDTISIGIINCNSSTENGQRREEGFKSYIQTIENAEIVSVVNVDSSVESATQGAINLLTNYPKINVLVGFNEFMTLGIGNAIEKLSLSDTIRAVGFDSNVTSIGMLESGEMDALIVQNPFSIGYLGIQHAVDLLEGNATEMTVYTQTSLITKENMFDEENQKLLFRFQ